jgi:uncharacterized protein YbgA (DUF1722 family)/uncharacterized protein YbbK (DUF523 family)
MTSTIKIGVSSCLLGQQVRFDGGHKRSSYIDDTLGTYFDFVSFCPEMAIGLGVPRPTIRLIRRNNKVLLVDSKNDQIDHTEKMKLVSRQQCQKLQDLSGYILKSKSPSCGMERINVYNEKNYPDKSGVGIFAYELKKIYPDLPIEEEGRLNDANLRENFIERIFAYYRWQLMLMQGITVSSLMHYHKSHKFILLAHDEATYRQLGPLIAQVSPHNLLQVASSYIASLMQSLTKQATRKKHMNVLQHAMGYLKEDIKSDDKLELLDVFNKYREGQLPLIVPITLLKHHLRKNPQPYIDEQHYMNPYPEELMLRNHV